MKREGLRVWRGGHRPHHEATILLAAAALAFAAAMPIATAQSTTPTKPPVGIPGGSRFFNGKWYYVHLEKGTWQSARDKCTRLGGQLAVVPDGRTHEFVKSLANDLNLRLGATDERVEGLWVWVDGAPMGFQAWHPGQPDNARGREHYLETWRGGVWNDNHAKSPVVGFICEWKAR